MAVVQMIFEAMAAAVALVQPAPLPSYQPPTPAERCQSAAATPDDRWLASPTVDGMTLGGRTALAALDRRGRTVVAGGNFRGADLRGLRLGDVCFVDADFSGSDWRRARASGLVMAGGALTGANLAGSDLRNVVLSGLSLDDVDLSGARLAGGRIVGGAFLSLEGLRLGRADFPTSSSNAGLRSAIPVRRRTGSTSAAPISLARSSSSIGAPSMRPGRA